MPQKTTDIFERLRAGTTIPANDPELPKMWKKIAQTIKLSAVLNQSDSVQKTREYLSEIIGQQIDGSTIIFVPFHTNFGKHIKIGRNVFINHDCTFLDLGGITIEDDVQIGSKVSLISESHPLDPNERKSLILKSVTIKKNAWIGAGATFYKV